MPRWRRVLRIVGRVALCTVAIVALVVGASWSLLQTKRGSEALRRFALPRVNATVDPSSEMRKPVSSTPSSLRYDVTRTGANAGPAAA